MLVISADDGSINVSWFDGIKIETNINPNTFCKGCKRAALPADKESVA